MGAAHRLAFPVSYALSLLLAGCAGWPPKSQPPSGMAIVDLAVIQDPSMVAAESLAYRRGNVMDRRVDDIGYISPATGKNGMRESRRVADLLLFPDLPPGAYYLRRLEHKIVVRAEEEEDENGSVSYVAGNTRGTGHVFQFEGNRVAPTFEIQPGRLTYVGKIVIVGGCESEIRLGLFKPSSGSVHKTGRCDWTHVLDANPEHERTALERLQKSGISWPWSKLVKVRLAELKQSARSDTSAAGIRD